MLTASTKTSVARANNGLKAVTAAALALLLALILLWAVNRLAHSGQQSEPSANTQLSTAAPAVATAALTTSAMPQAAVAPSTVDELPVDENSVVVRVNTTTITQDDLLHAAKIDAIVAMVVGQPVDPGAQVALDLLINGTVVTQQAAKAGFTITEAASQQALRGWLAAVEAREASLQRALTANDLSFAAFQARFTQLLLIDRYLQEATTQTGLDRNTLLQQWQAESRISFGPVANQLATIPMNIVAPASAQPAASPPVAQAAAPEKIGPFTLWQDRPVAQAAPTVAAAVAISADQAAIAVAPETATTATETIVTTTQESTTTTNVDLPPIGLAPGNRAPNFTLARLGEEGPSTLATWQGSPIVLSFWTTWCPYCRKQTPILVDAANAMAETDIQFIGIDVSEAADPVTAYVAEHEIPYPILLDSEGTVATAYNVRGYPTTYFIDAAGQIVAKHVGALKESQLRDYLNQLQPATQ